MLLDISTTLRILKKEKKKWSIPRTRYSVSARTFTPLHPLQLLNINAFEVDSLVARGSDKPPSGRRRYYSMAADWRCKKKYMFVGETLLMHLFIFASYSFYDISLYITLCLIIAFRNIQL